MLNNHEWIDLGLSVRWATCNMGATNPDEVGHYYAWGEIQEKHIRHYTYDHYQYAGDVVRLIWGKDWRMPTKQEQDELRKKCVWQWTRLHNNYGYSVTGPNGQSIFLPASGVHYGKGLVAHGQQGTYWAQTLHPADADYAYFLHFTPEQIAWRISRCFYGRSIRPVCDLNDKRSQSIIA